MSEERRTESAAEPRWSERAQEFLTVFSKGAVFTEELLADNSRLRHKVAELEHQLAESPANGDEALRALQRKLEQVQAKYDDLLNQHSTVERENQNFAQRYLEIEEENNNLANLYIASFQLHSTLNFRDVVQIIQEIVINLIGAEFFAIYVRDPQGDQYAPVASEGQPLEDLAPVPNGSAVGKLFSAPDVFINESIHAESTVGPDRPIVVIPLSLKEETVGAISIFGFLSQKEKIADVDRELFSLLAGHAATAIFSARLYAESERKLNTMQGFIDLLTK